MATTRAKIQRSLIGDFGPLLRIAEMDAATVDTDNASLEGPICDGVFAAGGTVADPPAVTDADVLTVTAAWRRFMQFVRLYTLERIWGNWPHVDEKAGEESQMLSQLAKRLQERMKEIKDELADPNSIENASVLEGAPTVGLIEAGEYLPGDLWGSNPFGKEWPYR